MMHKTLMDLLAASLDGQTSREETAILESHLKGCVTCRDSREQWRRDAERLKTLRCETSEKFILGVMDRVRSESAGSRNWMERIQERFSLKWVAPLGALGVFLLTLWLRFPMGSGSVPSGSYSPATVAFVEEILPTLDTEEMGSEDIPSDIERYFL